MLDDDDEDLEGADAMLADMARLREAALVAEREAQDYMDESLTRSGLLGRPPGIAAPPAGYPPIAAPGLPPGMPSMFPGLGMGPPSPPGGIPAGLFPPGRGNLIGGYPHDPGRGNLIGGYPHDA
ncbi:hypothetical protein GPECTOR_20g575 [Gonium pectorale]|uniref:Uncharacterized protein n=1 Tax=Gonium pectorale TaxID=33097 RepID=A0A150GIR9_GONPE|nr:hypothetical protein GPECTOR_20g575 [Gonium pectorale]|eukprot:KXZ49718.1 hypothetical protein GPECTOR_20g575 [Gonium pectorale]